MLSTLHPSEVVCLYSHKPTEKLDHNQRILLGLSSIDNKSLINSKDWLNLLYTACKTHLSLFTPHLLVKVRDLELIVLHGFLRIIFIIFKSWKVFAFKNINSCSTVRKRNPSSLVWTFSSSISQFDRNPYLPRRDTKKQKFSGKGLSQRCPRTLDNISSSFAFWPSLLKFCT